MDMATKVVNWQRACGRNDLPWQNSSDPYRVWLSEIMLQQTQVTTVLAYFPRFLNRFPDVAALAAAPLDDVLGLWSGLGYYSRARNLHACAIQVVALHRGVFPQTARLLQTLPGIGRSTAAAIAALCFGERVAILDGNVRRVLTRVLAYSADLSVASNERDLWALASKLLPLSDLRESMPRYTQGMMDLGATVCTARRPACARCPLAEVCVAQRLAQAELYPVKTRKTKRSAQSIWLLCSQTQADSVWLCKRPSPGIWGGLYCFPLFDTDDALAAAVPARYRSSLHETGVFLHVLTHRDLFLHPVQLKLPSPVKLDASGSWFAPDHWPQLGLPAPVRRLLSEMGPFPAPGAA